MAHRETQLGQTRAGLTNQHLASTPILSPLCMGGEVGWVAYWGGGSSKSSHGAQATQGVGGSDTVTHRMGDRKVHFCLSAPSSEDFKDRLGTAPPSLCQARPGLRIYG